MKRRSLVIGGIAGAAALGLIARPRDTGGPHPPYFRELGAALSAAGIAGPTLVVDRARLQANARTLQGHIRQRFDYRIVAKSLPFEVFSHPGSYTRNL